MSWHPLDPERPEDPRISAAQDERDYGSDGDDDRAERRHDAFLLDDR